LAAHRRRCRPRPTQGSLRPRRCLRSGPQARLAELPGHSLGFARHQAVQPNPRLLPPHHAPLRLRMGDVSHHPYRERPRLALAPPRPWDSLDIKQFNRIPAFFRRIMRHYGFEWETFHIIPIESGRGCPYGCEFCTVTGFFGDSIRFRTNQSIVDEMLKLKQRARATRGKFAVFFVDDNFAINVKRTKSLLRDIIAAGAGLNWVAQISANLLRDPELLDLIAASGGKWIFIGMESLDPANLASVNKSFNKPSEYAGVLQSLANRNIYAITSFIFGLDNDTPGVAQRTLDQMREWPPVLPVFGQITPFPATPLYTRLQKEGDRKSVVERKR